MRLVEHALQEYDVGLTGSVVLGLHAVIGRDGNDRTHLVHVCEITVHHPIKIIGALRARGGLVLEVGRRRQVHDVRPPRLEQLIIGTDSQLLLRILSFL